MAALALPASMVLGLLLALDVAAIGGLDLESDPARLLVLLAQFAAFLLVPAAVSAGLGGRAADLGLRRPSAGAAIAGVLLAPLALLLNVGYHVVVRALSPSLVAALEEEVRRQAEAFAAPWPLLIFVGVVLGPLGEEILFRGFLYGGLRTSLGRRSAAALSAALFALFHQMLVAAPGLFVLGLLLASLYERDRSLGGPVALHATFNLLVLGVQRFAP